MASTGLITAEQLQTVVQAIMNKVLKVNVEDGIVTAQFGDLTVTYNNETKELAFSKDGVTSLIVTMSDTVEDNRNIVSIDEGIVFAESVSCPTLDVGVLQPYGGYGGVKPKFCLPSSSSKYRTMANDPQHGGGILLTTRHRAYEPVVYNITSEQGTNAVVYPYVYTVVTGTDAVSLTFEGIANEVNEYWLDIDFPGANPPAVVIADFENGGEVVWTGEGEPDWSTLGGRRIQIHILAGMASYVISAEEGNSEYGGAIEE